MKQSRLLIAVTFAFALSGCDTGWSGSRYQLVTSSDGKVYRLDSQSGTVHYVTPEKMLALNDELPTLHVGEYYQMADASGNVKYLKYVGNAQFEKSPASSQVK
ncbi:hypothetical protein [Undibacterium pigrum]|uniref:Lipoprotein n=1 Tax=Undibacterium pigrum TaxID=401470 RepID=A0A318JCP3_9BURK|nr:hypothetical protein [Undibacterium pigrum]PXX41588.1 hypothetical protein DFR42_107239 [Undibacterium pigrum]